MIHYRLLARGIPGKRSGEYGCLLIPCRLRFLYLEVFTGIVQPLLK